MKSWNEPSPSGPSRRTVGGTSPQPSASDSRYAADLPPVEPAREVPQRTLAPAGLVDGPALGSSPAGDGDQEGGVGAPGHAALDLDLAALEQRQRRRSGRPRATGEVVRHQFIRGQGWPSGSIGSPQNRQAGRPEATSSAARPAKASAWPPVSVASRTSALVERDVEDGDQLRRVLVVLVVLVGRLQGALVQLLDRDDEAVEVGVPSHAELAHHPRPAPSARPARARWAAVRRRGPAGPGSSARGTGRAPRPAASRT